MSADDAIAAEQDRYTEPVDPYWSERAPAPPREPAPALTPDAATTAIAAKLDDPDFAKRYYGEYEKGHNDAVGEMAGLYSLAHPGDGPPLIERPAEPTMRRPDAPATADTDAAAGDVPGEPSAELQAEHRAEELLHLLGDNAGERCDTARAWLGPEMVEAVNATEFGNDPQAIAEMVDLAERDTEGLVRANVNELLGKQIYHSGATLERKRLEADQEFVDAYLKDYHPGHGAAMAKMEALRLLEHPPKWAYAAMEKLHANR